MMGTNYYVVSGKTECPECGHDTPARSWHIGKSSGGWKFALHVEDGVTFVDVLRKMLEPGVEIHDEYGAIHSVEGMLQIIMQRERYRGSGGRTLLSSPSVALLVSDDYHWEPIMGNFT